MSVRLRHVATINPSTPEFELLPDTAELPFLPLEAVWPGDRLDTTRRQSKAAVSTGYTRFREGDILLPKITPTFQADRTVIAVGIEGGVGAGTTELHVVRAGPDADVRYLRYLLSSKKFLDEGEASMLGVAGQKRVPDDCLRDLRVPVVDLRHQRAIADYLDRETARIDALIEKKQRMLGLLQERRQTLITAAVTGKLEIPGLAPRGDRVSAGAVPLKRLFSSVRGGAWGTEPGTDDVTLPCVRGTDFDYAHLRVDLSSAPLRGFSRADVAMRAARRNDLIIEKSGGGETQPVGRVALHDHDDLVMPTNFAGRLRPARDVDSRFACYVFASLYAGGRTRAAIKQTTGIQNLDLDALLATRVSCPVLPEQRAIAEYLDRETARIDALIETIDRQIDLLVEHRQVLITAAVTGELEIPGVAA